MRLNGSSGQTRRFLIGVVAALTGCNESAAPQVQAGTIRIRNGDVTLEGTLDLPSSQGPFPLMIFVPGSGRTTRESDRAAVSVPVSQGVAVFTYDKRGLGGSSGTFEEVGTENSQRVLTTRASDVKAIVDHFSTDSRIRSNLIFLWGTSQGAWVAPLVATMSNKVAFIICVVGGGSPVGTVIEYERLGRDGSLTIDQMHQRIATYSGPFGYDPTSTLETLRVPVLWIYGGLDRNTPSHADTARLASIKAAKQSDFTVVFFPGMNHDMVEPATGMPPANLFPGVISWAGPLLMRR